MKETQKSITNNIPQNELLIIDSIKALQNSLDSFEELLRLKIPGVFVSINILTDVTLSVQNELEKGPEDDLTLEEQKVALTCYFIIRYRPLTVALIDSILQAKINEMFCSYIIMSLIHEPTYEFFTDDYFDFLVRKFQYGELTRDAFYVLIRTLRIVKDSKGRIL